jgi:CubicO group peptidase (beta-lactamase class C family)
MKWRLSSWLLNAVLVVYYGCVVDAPFKVHEATVPEELNDAWTIASPQSVGLNPDSVDKIHRALMDESKYYNALGLLIVKDDRLVFESYPRGLADRDHFHHIQSAKKSFTSMALGICYTRGLIDSLDGPLYAYLGDKFPDDLVKRDITLRHVLTMRSGLKADNSDFAYTMLVDKPADPASFILHRPLYAPPGDSMYYRDCDPQLVSYVIQRVTGSTEEQLMKQTVFEPLEISDFYWEPNHDGVTSGGYGLHLKPRDMAKIGRLLVNHGKWQGQQILDSSWIALSTQPMVQMSWGGIEWNYGFYWWVLPQYGGYTASGHGGQFICVVPHQKLVIVMISKPDSNGDYVGTSLKGFLELAGPVLENP